MAQRNAWYTCSRPFFCLHRLPTKFWACGSITFGAQCNAATGTRMRHITNLRDVRILVFACGRWNRAGEGGGGGGSPWAGMSYTKVAKTCWRKSAFNSIKEILGVPAHCNALQANSCAHHSRDPRLPAQRTVLMLGGRFAVSLATKTSGIGTPFAFSTARTLFMRPAWCIPWCDVEEPPVHQSAGFLRCISPQCAALVRALHAFVEQAVRQI